jgi:hypothetical protein
MTRGEDVRLGRVGAALSKRRPHVVRGGLLAGYAGAASADPAGVGACPLSLIDVAAGEP